jgi:hypothetical protein
MNGSGGSVRRLLFLLVVTSWSAVAAAQAEATGDVEEPAGEVAPSDAAAASEGGGAPAKIAPAAPAPPAAATPPVASPPTAGTNDLRRLLVIDLQGRNVDEETTKTIGSVLQVRMGRIQGLEILTNEDIRRLMEVEVDRSRLACDMDSSCIAEVASAMGADLTMYGDVGRLGDTYVINLHLLDGSTGSAVSRTTVSADDLSDVPGKLDAGISELLTPLGIETGHEESPAERASDDAVPWVPIAVGGVGAVLLVAGGVVLAVGGFAFGDYSSQLQTADQLAAEGDLSGASLQDYVDSAKAAEQSRQTAVIALPAGGTLAALGVAAIAGGAVLWVLSPADTGGVE